MQVSATTSTKNPDHISFFMKNLRLHTNNNSPDGTLGERLISRVTGHCELAPRGASTTERRGVSWEPVGRRRSMRRNYRRTKSTRSKIKLGLPELEYVKTSVINSLRSLESQ